MLRGLEVAVQHVVTVPTPPFLAAHGTLAVHQIPVWEDNLVWLAMCMATREAVVVDGPPLAEPVLDYCAEHGIRLVGIWNTHHHGDHVGINHALASKGLLDGLHVAGPARKAGQIPGLVQPVDEGDVVRVGDVEARVWLTEGHVDGHVSYVLDGVVFCGDTLFAGGCGYLFDGPPRKMFDSLMRLASLDGDTRVCCAHEYTQDNLRFAWTVEPGNAALAERIRRVWAVRAEGRSAVPSTIEEERATNPFLRPGSPDLRRHLDAVMGHHDALADVFASTRALKDRKAYKALSDAELPL